MAGPRICDWWQAIATAATWTKLAEVRRTFPTADGVEVASRAIATVFNIKCSNYRPITIITYPALYVAALQLLTHAEYDGEKWKRNPARAYEQHDQSCRPHVDTRIEETATPAHGRRQFETRSHSPRGNRSRHRMQ